MSIFLSCSYVASYILVIFSLYSNKQYIICSCTQFTTIFVYSVVEDYAKWQLLVNELSLYIASLPQDSWRILQDIKFPRTSKLSQDTKLNCVELVENAMPLAVARPFVEEFITDSTIVKVSL